jgi:hypothetical protein
VAKRQFTKGIDLAAHQMKRLVAMQATIGQSVDLMKKEGVKDNIELTGGQIKKQELRKMGHPYGRGRASGQGSPAGRKRGRAPLLPLNLQSGRLRRAMRSRNIGTKQRPGFETYASGVAYAKYILSESGTRKMVARGMKKEANRRLKARQAAHVQHFVRKQRSI